MLDHVPIKLKHPKCPVCGKAMCMDGVANFACIVCRIIVFTQIVGKMAKDD